VRESKLPTVETPLLRLPWDGRADVWVKDEGRCPTGTFKDRLAWRLADLLEPDADPGALISSITMGNTALSLAEAFSSAFSDERRPQLFCVFPTGFSSHVIGPDNIGREMLGSRLLRRVERLGCVCEEYALENARLSQQDIAALATSRGLSFSSHRDVSYGIEVAAYESILAEALESMSEAPSVVVVPVGAGVLFEEFVQYVERYELKVRVIGVTTLLADSVADKIYGRYSPFFDALIRDGEERHPLYPRHLVLAISDDMILSALSRIPMHVAAEPSAAAAFAMLDVHSEIAADQSVLVVNTGNGVL